MVESEPTPFSSTRLILMIILLFFFEKKLLLLLSLLCLVIFLCAHNSSQLARKYLAIPASQASCERLFSVAKNDVTEKRTLMKPDLIEALIFIGHHDDILV